MGILDSIINDLKGDPISGIDESVKIISDKIYDEEKGKFEYPDRMPKGANIFLAIECKGRDQGEVGYLCLEREAPGSFFVGYWTGPFRNTGNEGSRMKRVKSWDIKEADPNKIIIEYARIMKYLVKE